MEDLAVFLEQFAEVFVFPAGCFKVENVVFYANTQVIERFLEGIGGFAELFGDLVGLVVKRSQFPILCVNNGAELLGQFP
jgi:hypothetical protein